MSYRSENGRRWTEAVALFAVVVVAAAGCGALTGQPERSVQSQVETVLDSVVHIEVNDLPVPEVSRLDTLSTLERRYVDIGDNVELYVVQEGSGPVLVLINGGPGNSLHSFLPHFSAARSFARVVYYDQRGTGLSDWEPGLGGYSTSEAIDDLEKLRRALGIDRWFVLGHSYGGLIAQWYALRYPERLRGLVLVGSSVPIAGLNLGEREFRSQEERDRIRGAYAIDGEAVVPVHGGRVDLATLQRMLYNGYINGDWKRQYFFKPSLERMAQIARYEWVHDRDFNRQLRKDGFALDLRGVFAEFPIPTLIVEGAQDANWGPAKPRLFADQHPRAELVVLDSAAHYPFAERPSEFFAVLQVFVDGARPVSEESIRKWKDAVGGEEGQ